MSAVIGDGGDFQLFGDTMHITWRVNYVANVFGLVLDRREDSHGLLYNRTP